MDVVIIIAAVALSNVLCFLIGAKTGLAVARNEPIELPAAKAFDYTKQQARQQAQQEAERKAAELEQRQLETILRNIDNYDGTSRGQEDVPRG